jgi:hypothetical protein
MPDKHWIFKTNQGKGIPMLKAAISQIKLPQDRGSLLSIAKAAVTLLSLGTAHYVGFLIHIPFEILSIVSIKFLPQFVATCSFYLTLCYLTARIFSFGISQLYYSASAPLAGFSIAASKWLPKRLKNGASRRIADKERIALIWLMASW